MSAIIQRFNELTLERERPVESDTEARGYPTDNGYVHEVVSRSPNRQTITKRVTVTQSGGDGVNNDASLTAPTFRYQTSAMSEYTSSEVAGASTAPASSYDRRSGHPSRPTSSGNSAAIITGHSVRSPTTTSPASQFVSSSGVKLATYSPVPQAPWQRTAPDRAAGGWEEEGERVPAALPPREVESLGQMVWVTTTPQRRQASARNGGGSSTSGVRASPAGIPVEYPPARRGVSIGGSETTLIEPSRISPLLVKEAYAPVRYMSKRQIREMRSEWVEPRPQRLQRQGSVPQLDAWMEDQLRAEQQQQQMLHQQQQQPYYPPRQLQPLQLPHGGREFWPNGGEGDAQPDETPGGRSSMRSTPTSRSGSAHYQRNMYPRGRPAADYAQPQEEDDERWDSISQRSSQYSAYRGGPQQQRYPHPQQQQQYYNDAPHSGLMRQVTTLDTLPDVVHVMDMAERIAFTRRVSNVPQPPPQCQDAFRLLFRGTYLIKYGRQGPPHERFLAMRLVENELTRRPEPFLVWATHEGAASFKERIHLALLIDVVPGLQSPGNKFARHLVTNTTIAGPSLGGKKCVLPTNFVFSLVFSGGDRRRTLDCLCLDEQTYHCWLMVCQYFAAINNGGGQLASDMVEQMAPDTPRSMSAAR